MRLYSITDLFCWRFQCAGCGWLLSLPLSHLQSFFLLLLLVVVLFCCSDTFTHSLAGSNAKANTKDTEQKIRVVAGAVIRFDYAFLLSFCCAVDCNGYRMPMQQQTNGEKRSEKKHRELYVKRFGMKHGFAVGTRSRWIKKKKSKM